MKPEIFIKQQAHPAIKPAYGIDINPREPQMKRQQSQSISDNPITTIGTISANTTRRQGRWRDRQRKKGKRKKGRTKRSGSQPRAVAVVIGSAAAVSPRGDQLDEHWVSNKRPRMTRWWAASQEPIRRRPPPNPLTKSLLPRLPLLRKNLR